MATTIKLRRGILADWERVNPILADGEPAWAIDAFILKVGNGKLRWSELPAINVPDIDPADIENAVNKYLDEHPIFIETDATLSVAGAPADAAAVRMNCILNDDTVILYGGNARA